MKRLQNTPLYISAKRALMDYLRKENMGGKKLPSEEVLAQYLGVGKTTVREAMASLLQNGVITKRRGRDSIAVESALSASMRFDLFVDFVDMLVDAGYSIVLRQTPIKSVILEDCDEDTGSTGLEFKYYYMVDDRAAIISRIRIPDRVIVKPPPPQAAFRNVTDLFYSCTKETINHSLAFFTPAICDPENSSAFGIPEGSPLISWRQVSHNHDDSKICYAWIEFNPSIVTLSALTKGGYDYATDCTCELTETK